MAPPLSQTEPVELSIAEAVVRYAEGAAEEQNPAAERRLYSLPEVAVVLSVAAVCLFSLETEGLLTWSQRMDVGPVQSAAVWVLRTAHAVLEPLGLSTPRRAALDAADRLSRMFGAGDDPLLAGGWRHAEASPGWRTPSPDSPEVDAEPPEGRRFPAGNDPSGQNESAAGEDGASTDPAAVLLIGDSMMAGSLGSAIASTLSGQPKPRLVRAVQTATGLSRPDVFDWMKIVPPLLERDRPQLIVCSLGANDATDIRDGDRVLEFGRGAWRSAYARRVKAMMQMLAGRGARVLWLGLPPMRNPAFSDRTRSLNRIFAQAANSLPRVEYFDVEALVSRNGEYATFLRSQEGQFVRVRMEDGVHYSPSGARSIARWVVDWIDEQRGGHASLESGRIAR